MDEHTKMLHDISAEAKHIANRLISPIEQYLIAKRKLDKVIFEKDVTSNDSAYKNMIVWEQILKDEIKDLLKVEIK